MKLVAAISAANGFSRSLEQIETALANDDLYSGEVVVQIAAAATTQERLRNLLPQLITRLAAVAAEEKEAAAAPPHGPTNRIEKGVNIMKSAASAPTPTLEPKIVKALTDETVASNDLANLLTETETAIAIATNDATVAEVTALDPLQSPDPVRARATMEDAKFRTTRLRNLLPRLQSRYEEMNKREVEAAWIVQYDALKPQRDALAEEVKTVYAAAVAKIIPTLRRIEHINAEVSRLHQSKPPRAYGDDDGRWLSAIPPLKLLALPNPDKPGELSWPPPAKINYANITPILGTPGSDWWQATQAENARGRIEDEARAAALHEKEGRVRNDPKLWRRG
jgi:hypothetical protein